MVLKVNGEENKHDDTNEDQNNNENINLEGLSALSECHESGLSDGDTFAIRSK